ncbi:putative mitochondrial hypothetical protein [Leptomonas pyrrhocoris]|uniref:GRAM domain-containing protein n=1 Tax=Leptomonas pyrrhocoris TaxID=157538 RepID=A0A0N0DS49_LEPPY|nr:putative mitochondrial hypothetical protein [Leptomonas pyrrhocoris]XP_015653902.1 putative mitochondrial hypothetical protein [Leptomonas pyrrhocoris]XP_015653903.1 putative mitochondrial hypothetical protein [Leptomonas pyrrhocoris]KPA75462.1 putative mitochondrial hypothetical protein [Leptomonas pyrrhocoris]KPA75463.1 putative mitochondrial hypothetical protein [Leptomonas pyrrhocoris]KPA75464.1 putative mitochondrial hypothetical protein [Leptomonas pyrrhocoris]|eukprot:XP_015653901.1 putative mitochondrial hypothetical protein [Leptomonas pyrrhocoris]
MDPVAGDAAAAFARHAQANPGAQEIYVELVSLTYSGAVPTPAPACTDQTPDEQYRQAIAQRQEALKQKEEARQHQLDESKEAARHRTSAAVEKNESMKDQLAASASEVYANLRSAVSQAAMSLEKGASDVSLRTEAQVRQLEYQHNCESFRQNFPDLAQAGEVLLADYACSAMHGGLKVSGHLQITRHYLCFFAETSSAIAKATETVMEAFASARQAATAAATGKPIAEHNASAQPQLRMVGIKQVIPLSQVACVLPSVVLDTVGNLPPFFLPLPAETVQATALQVYVTSENRLFQFLCFDSLISRASGKLSDSVKGTALDRAFNYLDHAWRESVEVPLKDVEYA